jgi:hypothetical protein
MYLLKNWKQLYYKMSESKKLLKIELEPDMWFEILDMITERVEEMKQNLSMTHWKYKYKYKPDIKYELNYAYRNTILKLLEHKLLNE